MPKKFNRPPSMLSQIYNTLNELAIRFRDKVCIECDWSTPTFYRKIRKGDISNAEKDKIIEVFIQIQSEANNSNK